MNIEQQALNDVLQNRGMADDPSWSAQERQKYQAAYAATKQRLLSESV